MNTLDRAVLQTAKAFAILEPVDRVLGRWAYEGVPEPVARVIQANHVKLLGGSEADVVKVYAKGVPIYS